MTTYSLHHRSSDLGEHLERRSVGSTPASRFRTPNHTVSPTGNPTPQRSTKIWATAAAAFVVVAGVGAVASVSGSDPEPEQVGAVDQSAVADWADANGRTGSSPTSLTLIPPQPSATQLIQQSIDDALASRPSATPAPSATQLIQQSIDDALANRPVATPERPDTQLIQQAIDAARAETASVAPVPVPSTADGAERRVSAQGGAQRQAGNGYV